MIPNEVIIQGLQAGGLTLLICIVAYLFISKLQGWYGQVTVDKAPLTGWYKLVDKNGFILEHIYNGHMVLNDFNNEGKILVYKVYPGNPGGGYRGNTADGGTIASCEWKHLKLVKRVKF